MDISSKKSRTELTGYFKKNSIPTQDNFADFIGSTLNQYDDGIFKPAGDNDPLCVQAAKTDQKPVFHFYERFIDPDASWFIGLADGSGNGSGNRGFSLGNPKTSEIRFFIEMATGNVGIGTTDPADGVRLDVNGNFQVRSDAKIIGALNAQSTATITGALNAQSTATITGALNAQSTATITGALNAQSTATITGALNAQSTATITGALNAQSAATITGALNANSTLAVAGLLTANNGLTVSSGKTTVGTLEPTAIVANGANANADLPIAAKGTGNISLNSPVSATNSLAVTGALNANSTLAVAGLLTANNGLTVSSGKTTVGTLEPTAIVANGANANADLPIAAKGTGNILLNSPVSATNSLAVTGALNANSTLAVAGLLTANNGLTVSSGKTTVGTLEPTSIVANSPDADANLPIAAKGTGSISLNSPVSATKGLVVTGGDTTLGTTATNQPLTVHGLITAKSLTVSEGSTSLKSVTADDVTIHGAVTANNGFVVSAGNTSVQTLDANGLVTVNNGLTVSTGKTTVQELQANGIVNATKGLAVTGANATIGTTETNRSLTVHGDVDITGTLKLAGTSAKKIATAEKPKKPEENEAIPTVAFVNAAIPIGAILMWSGTLADIPKEWKLCDGSNGTPNLTDRFVLGGYPPPNPKTGGNSTITLTKDNIPKHKHYVTVNAPTYSIDGTDFGANNNAHRAKTGKDNSGGEVIFSNADIADRKITHSHTTTETDYGGGTETDKGKPFDNMPPYYVLAFIMRVS